MRPASGDLRIELEGQAVWLLPERGAFWEEQRTLLIADPHWGKAATFRAGGIPVPMGTTGDGVARLVAMVARAAPRRIAFLGDFLHAREGRSPEVLAALSAWRSACPDIELLLVRGNHDRHAGDPPANLAIDCVSAPYRAEPFVLAHHPVISGDGHVVAGHIHPSVRLRGLARQHLRLPCFVVGDKTTVLPAFGDFTGAGEVEPLGSDRVYVVTDEEVLSVSAGS